MLIGLTPAVLAWGQGFCRVATPAPGWASCACLLLNSQSTVSGCTETKAFALLKSGLGTQSIAMQTAASVVLSGWVS